MAVAEAGVGGADADVGKQRYHQAGSHRDAVDSRDDRLLTVGQVVDQVAHLAEHPGHQVVIANLPLDHGKVAASGERAAGAGNHGDPRLLVSADVRPDGGELGVHLLVRGVQHVWPVERDEQDAVRLPFELQVLVTVETHATRLPFGAQTALATPNPRTSAKAGYSFAAYRPAAARSMSALSVRSQVKSGSLRPKC